MSKEFEAQKTQNPDELPESERSPGHEQVHGVADVTFEIIAQHPVIILEVAEDWLDGSTTTEPFPGLPLVRSGLLDHLKKCLDAPGGRVYQAFPRFGQDSSVGRATDS